MNTPLNAPVPVGAARSRVIHTGQAVADVVLRVPAVPAAGEDVFASAHQVTAGGGFNTMAAAARDGASVLYAGSHGTGTFGDLVRAALRAEGIEAVADPLPDLDTGFSVALVDDAAERTFVSTVGAEGRATRAGYEASSPQPGDVVVVSGYSLLHTPNREALAAWLPGLDPGVRVVVDPSPMIAELEARALAAVIARCDVWTTNEREARDLLARDDMAPGEASRNGIGAEEDRGANADGQADESLAVLARRLSDRLGCDVVLRAGARGSLHARRAGEAGPSGAAAPRADVELFPALPVTPVDTNGAGDAHCGVMGAGLAPRRDLAEAVHRAGVAAGIAVTRFGPATSPGREEIDAVIGAAGV